MEFEFDQMIEPLILWYEKSHRDLPWRNEPTPYHVWVSEIMLQQTRVEAVKRYYTRFLETLPTIEALSECEEDVLLKLWEGLGYYNRVRNMQKAARTIVEEYDGKMPNDYESILKLKGIGTYTAGAISSIAFGIPVPAVDGNVLRILMRAAENDSDIAKTSVKTAVEKALLPVMPEKKAGTFNQAMMELGATVCVPNGEPNCTVCPWSHICKTYKNGTWQQYPVKSKLKARRIEKKTILLVSDGKKVLLHKRPQKGLLAGLYEFPNIEGSLSSEDALVWVKENGYLALQIEELPEAKHIFSHVEWHMKGFYIRIEEVEGKQAKEFANKEALEVTYAVPSAFSVYTEYAKRMEKVLGY